MKDIPELIDGLKGSIHVLTAFVESLPQEMLDLQRRHGFWTIAEHISHLAQVQPMLLERLERFKAEDQPVFVPYIPGEEEEASDTPLRMEMAVALEQFSQVRGQQIELLKGADQLTWQKMAQHPEYEQYGFYILTRHILMHDHWHMYRMEELWLTRDEYLTDLA